MSFRLSCTFFDVCLCTASATLLYNNPAQLDIVPIKFQNENDRVSTNEERSRQMRSLSVEGSIETRRYEKYMKRNASQRGSAIRNTVRRASVLHVQAETERTIIYAKCLLSGIPGK